MEREKARASDRWIWGGHKGHKAKMYIRLAVPRVKKINIVKRRNVIKQSVRNE